MRRTRFMIASLLLLQAFHLLSQTFQPKEIARWEKQAQQVTIIRDRWGIPHIYGKTDADAVFGLLYAQCEDDFKRVEMNYIEKLGRTAELQGKSALYDDLLIRLVIDSSAAVADYKRAPKWLKKLLDAHSDGINYYLYKHPEVKPALLTRFQPWYQLLWTDGSISAINTADISTAELEAFYGGGNSIGAASPKKTDKFEQTTGSNGFAFAPCVTASGKAILYINPHVTFYFRPEVHVVSEQGLNVYGAVTWGQMFVYQGFNEFCGWMHTSNYTDISDLYAEKVIRRLGRWYYMYEGARKPVKVKKIPLRYLEKGQMIQDTVDALFTRHGPVMAKRNGQWLSLKANNRSLSGLMQSWLRTKTRSFDDYKKVMNLLSNTSNNTVYADRSGNIAYWHGNFMPRRDTAFDWTKPVDGSISATEWKGLHPVSETVHLYNPPNGWLQNCNSTPFTAAGADSPRKSDYPPYMAPDGENFRGINAVRVLQKEKKYDLDKVIAAGYDTYMVAFEYLVPALLKVCEPHLNPSDPLSSLLAGPIEVLKEWDFRSSEMSYATALAVEWGDRLKPAMMKILEESGGKADQVTVVNKLIAKASTTNPELLLQPFVATIRNLQDQYGRWHVEWGEINRFQRISADIDQPFSDAVFSWPVAYTSALWGTLPSYTANYFPGTKKRYGINGNSFVCAVEFGDRIKAKSLLAGGQSGCPESKHFSDQAKMYAKGQFKDVLFYREDILKNAEKTYHPGQE